MLERRVLELGLDDHVEFDDRFLSIDELSDLLAATDVFVTPYRNREQIASGALTFAIAAGCGVVSTPYWYAQDMLASGAGTLVPFDDPAALADAVCDYIEQPETLAAARAEARRIGSALAWPSVAEATAAVLREALAFAPRRRPSGVADLHLDEPAHRPPAHAGRRRRHRPARRTGSSPTATAATASTTSPGSPSSRSRSRDRGDEQLWSSILYRSLAFLSCGRPATSGMRNFMGVRPPLARRAARRRPRRPLDLGARRDPRDRVDPRRRRPGARPARTARRLALGRRLVANGRLRGARPRRLDADRLDPDAKRLLERLVDQLADAHGRIATEDWSWFEDGLSYDNARLSQALISGGSALGRDDLSSSGSNRCAGSATNPGSATTCCACRAIAAGSRNEPMPAPATSSRSTPPRSSRPSWPPSRSPARPSTGAARARVRVVPRPQPPEKPLYDFATGGCSDGLGSEALEPERRRRIDARVPSRRSRSSTPRVSAHQLREPALRAGGRMSEPRALPPPPRQPDPHGRGLAVSGQRRLQPGGRRARRRDRPACSGRGPQGISHLSVARSANGIDGWSVDPEPLLAPDDDVESEQWGFEDPRVVWVDELDRWVITCTAYGPAGPAVFPRDHRGLHGRSSATGSSGSRRTRTPPCCPTGSTAAGFSSTARRPSSAAPTARSSSPARRSRQLERAGAGAPTPHRRVVGLAPHRHRPAAASNRARLAARLPRRQADGRRRHLPRRPRPARPRRADARPAPPPRLDPRAARTLRAHR